MEDFGEWELARLLFFETFETFEYDFDQDELVP